MTQRNIVSFLETSARSFPNKTALVFENKKTNYKNLLTASNRTADFLISNSPANRSIAIFMENCPSWLTSYFGTVASGKMCVLLSLRSSDDNLVSQLSVANVGTVVTSNKFLPRWKTLSNRLKNPILIVTPEIIRAYILKTPRVKPRLYRFSTMLFTSGATSSQKAICLSHKTIIAATRNIIDYLKPDCNDVYYATLPFYHSFGLGNIHTTLATGGTVVISKAGTNFKKIFGDIAKQRATFWAATPYTLEISVRHFLKDLAKAGKYLRKICTNTGPMSTEITKIILNKMPGMQFFTYYGLTEASRSSFIHYNLYPDKLESVGKPAPNVSICIVDRKDNAVAFGQIGEICIKGPHVVNKYWKMPELTKKQFRKGWFFTGDMGYFDEDGFLYVAGRKDDMVDIGGEKFSLQTVDKAILSQKDVQDAGSFLVANPRLNFIVGCVVPDPVSVLKYGADELKNKILENCRTQLDRHQIPSKIIFTNSIPRTDNGKIKRSFLKENHV